MYNLHEMTKKSTVAISKATKINAITVYQNHLNQLHGTINNFCETNKKFSWFLVSDKNKPVESKSEIGKYLSKKQPDRLQYLVYSDNYEETLRIVIENGISLVLTDASFNLVGLHVVVKDIFASTKVSVIISTSYRFAAITVPFVTVILPTILLAMTNWVFGLAPLIWFFVSGFFNVIFLMSAYEDALEISDFVMSTRIKYKEYSHKNSSSLSTLLVSTKALISIAASLATIIAFLISLKRR